MDFRYIVEKYAKNYEIYVYKARNIEANAEVDEFKSATRDYIEGIGIRIFDRCVGYAYTNSLDVEDVEYAARKAAKMAKISEEDYHIPENLGKRDVRTFSTEDFFVEDAIYHLTEMMNAAREANPFVRIDSASFSASIGERELITPTENFSEKFSHFSYVILGMEVKNEVAGSFNIEMGGTLDFKSINTREVGFALGESVKDTSYASKIDSFVGDAVFSPLFFYEIFIECLLNNVNGLNIISGSSVLKDKRGEKILGNISVEDNPLIDYMTSSYSFDREGVEPKRKYIVENGVLKTFLHNTKTSYVLGEKSTGNAAGGFRNPPIVGSGNIIVYGEEEKLENIIGNIKRGLLINRISGEVKINGDFSGAVKCSFLVEDGEIKKPIKNVQIYGNIFSLLKEDVVVSMERKNFGGAIVPYVAVRNIKVIS